MPKAPKPGYSVAEVLAVTDATVSNLKHWPRLELIAPSIEHTLGTGYPRRYSALDVIDVQLAAAVHSFRVPVDVIRPVVRTFRRFHSGAKALADERQQTLRSAAARSFILEHENEATALRMADAWAAFRASSLVIGEPNPAWAHFIGLFFNTQDQWATVAVDPPQLGKVIEGRAMVIDLAAEIFRIAQRCSTRGITPLGEL